MHVYLTAWCTVCHGYHTISSSSLVSLFLYLLACTLLLPVCTCSIANVAPFVTSQQQQTSAANVASAWQTFCTDILKRNSSACSGIATSISNSYAGGMGKRAGALCLALRGKLDSRYLQVQTTLAPVQNPSVFLAVAGFQCLRCILLGNISCM